MRWIALLVVAVAACTSAPPAPAPAPAPPAATPAPTPAQEARAKQTPDELPAAEPTPPSLREFRARAVATCTEARRVLRASPLQGDPLRDGATQADLQAAVAHYRARSAAWTAAADDLWNFGLPKRPAAQSLITALDTAAQYSQQAAEFLTAQDFPTAQAAVAAVDDAMKEADAVARRLNIPPPSGCDRPTVRLPGARKRAVDAFDFGFAVAEGGPGPTRFVLRNTGEERHHLFVVRLRNAGTVLDAVRADRAGEPPGQFLAGAGKVSAVAHPGERATVDINLRPGSYALLCFVASRDGTPHAYKGMATEISVE